MAERYYFHLRNAYGISLDEVGTRLDGPGAAAGEALRVARLIMREPSSYQDWRGWAVQVVDQNRAAVFVVAFESVRAVTGGDCEKQDARSGAATGARSAEASSRA